MIPFLFMKKCFQQFVYSTNIYIYTYIQIQLYIYICVCAYVWVYVCMYVCMYVCIGKIGNKSDSMNMYRDEKTLVFRGWFYL